MMCIILAEEMLNKVACRDEGGKGKGMESECVCGKGQERIEREEN